MEVELRVVGVEATHSRGGLPLRLWGGHPTVTGLKLRGCGGNIPTVVGKEQVELGEHILNSKRENPPGNLCELSYFRSRHSTI
ncbi:hypothetical protein SUGI_0558010 [Cryptomeria japonica]|nr:hypothetical protein SUGI_0558010 [Cryptomeria japonica]